MHMLVIYSTWPHFVQLAQVLTEDDTQEYGAVGAEGLIFNPS